jgi:hypothetical protein
MKTRSIYIVSVSAILLLGPLMPPVSAIPDDVEAITGAPPACPGAPIMAGGHPNSSSWVLWISLKPVHNTIEDVRGGAMADTDSGPNGDSMIPPIIDTYAVYGSWALGAATLNNGADGYVFGASVKRGNQQIGETSSGARSQAGCIYLGSFSNEASPIPMEYSVQGGVYGTTGSESCSQSFSVSVAVGVEASVQGPKVSATTTLGSSIECGYSTTWDSDIIFGQVGYIPI